MPKQDEPRYAPARCARAFEAWRNDEVVIGQIGSGRLDESVTIALVPLNDGEPGRLDWGMIPRWFGKTAEDFPDHFR